MHDSQQVFMLHYCATDHQLDEIEGAIRAYIQNEGLMRIKKAAGLFIAKGPKTGGLSPSAYTEGSPDRT